MSIRNIDTKFLSKSVEEETAALNLGGQVPAGMKRWVSFLSLDTMLVTGASSVRLYLASVAVSNPTKASLIATGNRKMLLDLRATGLAQAHGSAATATIGATHKQDLTPDGPPLMIPDTPDTEKPLFSIAAEKWLGVYTSYTTANVNMQYFDE
jgi:hypothetical protein